MSYDPATGLIIGVSTELSWFYGNPNTTKNSSISAGISVTTKKQIKFSVHSEIFTSNNTWLLGGDLRYWKFSQDTYGLGTGTLASNSQNMDFNFIIFEENLLYKVSKNLYAGIGFYLDSYNKIKTINPDNDSIIYPSFNSSYSKENNLDLC